MRSFGIVVYKPLIKVLLQGLQALVKVLKKGDPEELIQDCLIETLDKAVGLRRFDLGPAVLNVIQGQVKFKAMGRYTYEI